MVTKLKLSIKQQDVSETPTCVKERIVACNLSGPNDANEPRKSFNLLNHLFWNYKAREKTEMSETQRKFGAPFFLNSSVFSFGC